MTSFTAKAEGAIGVLLVVLVVVEILVLVVIDENEVVSGEGLGELPPRIGLIGGHSWSLSGR
ncbi:hypothetical protein LIX17_01655 [Mycobacterium avium subsp. hominissuis]|uniref:Uncharacterized protein n=1 Tax=Mycobacterium bouchedurhonense TaxID=701041 RepID=A0AAW5S6Y3_MYCBC|nr:MULTISPECIES: hypothetical protein [Mycobacterium avium complex (MAC)]ETZ45331.1 hypothetical protein L838_3784 [Mycobacterium avium MAV_120709_2344]MCA2334677.1 hypothetical protein [Mycobacterium avium]MCA4732544.1 hypothetical protein [Mycobacterium avium subsp. hominissuis]MCA4737957.1 hypothetical protein [Mycobacterium avium subsp. hominissuis]MCA4742338.1 hypothetical protein [Mycobacterium avium subsp. hominissuis]